jgi:hypothetical protein
LPAKSVKAAACRAAADPSTYSSITLRRLLAVAILALTSAPDRGGRPPPDNEANTRPRPNRAELDANAETRPATSYDVRSPGDATPAASDAGAVESISTMPATSSG